MLPLNSIQNSHVGLFLPNIPWSGGGGSLPNIKAVARSFNKVNMLKPGGGLPELHLKAL